MIMKSAKIYKIVYPLLKKVKKKCLGFFEKNTKNETNQIRSNVLEWYGVLFGHSHHEYKIKINPFQVKFVKTQHNKNTYLPVKYCAPSKPACEPCHFSFSAFLGGTRSVVLTFLS